jgi:predicted nucleotidyltransferase
VTAPGTTLLLNFPLNRGLIRHMGLSKQYLSENKRPVHFDPAELACVLRENLPEVDFCFLMGSAAGGTVAVGSDLDLAFYLKGKPSFEFFGRAAEAVRKLMPDVHCDTGILNNAEPVYRFEALKGRLLFTRDQESYLTFFSRTCREYESQMFDYERQRRYRREAAHAV